MTPEEILKWAALAAAVVGLGNAAWKYVLVPLLALGRFVQALLPVVEKFPKIEEGMEKMTAEVAGVKEDVGGVKADVAGVKGDMEKVRAEVTHNGGHSLKDIVRSVEKKTDSQTHQLNGMEKKIDEAARVAATASALARKAIQVANDTTKQALKLVRSGPPPAGSQAPGGGIGG